MKRITADEARALCGTDKAQETLGVIYERIRKAAALGQTQVRYATESDMGVYNWDREAKKPTTPLGRIVVEQLRKDGYTVTTYYEERQFVDLGLVISWSTSDDQ